MGMPRVGADARIYSGAVIAGPIAVGDNVMIGANAVVTRDIPPRTLVRPAPVDLVPLPERFQTGSIIEGEKRNGPQMDTE
jgi:serine acetyltransferase